MSAINSENRDAWQAIANDVSRQRPYPGRTGTVIGGRKLRGERVTVVRHQIDSYEDAFRYGGDASRHMREMRGRYGYVCLVRNDVGTERWIKARYLMLDFPYGHWSVALSDAMTMSV